MAVLYVLWRTQADFVFRQQRETAGSPNAGPHVRYDSPAPLTRWPMPLIWKLAKAQRIHGLKFLGL
jgi:hypothetical protein